MCTMGIKGVISIDVLVRLRTGFYQTTLCRMQSTLSEIVLTPEDHGTAQRPIVIDANDIVSVSLIRKKVPEIEIETESETYRCLLDSSIDLPELLSAIEDTIGTTILIKTF